MAQDLHQRARFDAEIRARLSYDPATGVFTRLKGGGRGAKAGDRAGSAMVTGYVSLSVCDRAFLAHRVAWFLATGAWPAGQIDHINGDRMDNRLCNLREVTNRQNTQNVRRARSSNRSTGVLGVYLDRRRGKLFASIMDRGCTRLLGYHATPEAAHEAYIAAKSALHEGFVQ